MYITFFKSDVSACIVRFFSSNNENISESYNDFSVGGCPTMGIRISDLDRVGIMSKWYGLLELLRIVEDSLPCSTIEGVVSRLLVIDWDRNEGAPSVSSTCFFLDND